MGFEDRRYYGPLGISFKTFHEEIEPFIPSDGRVDITNLVRNPKKGSIAFKRTAVEQALQELGIQQKLRYSPERFQYALEKV